MPRAHVSVYDNDTSSFSDPLMDNYAGPVDWLKHQYIAPNADSLCITCTAPNAFIHGGDGDDAIAVTCGNNVIDGGKGSNFLTSGSGHDTFFIDARDQTATTWSTLVNFKAGDEAIIWGIKEDMRFGGGFGGAEGYGGYTYQFHQDGGGLTNVTLAGYSGGSHSRPGISYGHSDDLPGLPGSDFMKITGIDLSPHG